MPHSPEYAYQLPYQNTGLFPCIKIIPYSYRNQYREPEHIYGIVNQRRADRILIPFLHQNHALLAVLERGFVGLRPEFDRVLP